VVLRVCSLLRFIADAMEVSDLVGELRSVREIYEGLSPSLRGKPFIVQRWGSEHWGKDTFFVVRRVVREGFRFFGDLYRDGQFIRSREGGVLPLSYVRVWVLLAYSTVVCVAVEAGICPKYEVVCGSVHKCSELDVWIFGIVEHQFDEDVELGGSS